MLDVVSRLRKPLYRGGGCSALKSAAVYGADLNVLSENSTLALV